MKFKNNQPAILSVNQNTILCDSKKFPRVYAIWISLAVASIVSKPRLFRTIEVLVGTKPTVLLVQNPGIRWTTLKNRYRSERIDGYMFTSEQL